MHFLKNIFFLFLFFTINCFSCVDDKKKVLVLDKNFQKFKKSLNKNLPSYGWITIEFLKMDVVCFLKSFGEVSHLLCKTPWIYFSKTKEEFDKWSYEKKRYSIFKECYKYDVFFQGLFVDVIDGSLMFLDKKIEAANPKEFKSIFDYFKSSRLKSYYDFYAFYLDYGFSLFVDIVQNSFVNIEDNFLFFYFEFKAPILYKYLLRLFSHLKFSLYEKRYQAQFRRYKNVLKCLLKEKKAFCVK